MSQLYRRLWRYLKPILPVILVLSLVAIIPFLVQAESSDLALEKVSSVYTSLPGRLIELKAEPLRDGLWTRIQWQDISGQWQDIEGWQGTFTDDEHMVRWYVGKDIKGTGPYRWLVFDKKGGALLATSEPFDLPQAEGETVRVEMSLPVTSSTSTVVTTSPKSADTVYVVEVGDDLSHIALKFNTTVKAIADANNIKDINLIFVGQKLIIPAG